MPYMKVIMYRPPKRANELYRILMNYRYMLIRWKSGKVYFIDAKTGDYVPNDIRKELLMAEKELIKERFGEDHWVYKLITKQSGNNNKVN